ncbi:MAG: recombinase family protein [Sphingobium sp.]|uniref:recombinase family protein n=1 Tax=Sphingomonadales TaxID=204457 RepID=UPI0009FBB51B|nr:recombinase family protein [Novosphingobium naphthalenivorans]MDF0544047.1 recombinase family protein [Sphingobium arseniciresistens]MDX3899867.1 recombinase family protein [Sphingobium sp.]
MARPRKAKETRNSGARQRSAAEKAVLYARVSTAEQEKEGFSIDAQIALIRDYAERQGFAIVEQYVDVETAKKTGRTQFEAMLKYLRAHPGVRHLLVEKTDRLYRNIKDWVTLDAFDIELHLVKEGTVLSHESRSSEKFMHGIKVLMAKNYVDNLSEEARKGMIEKAKQGIWPTHAPIGYLNVVGPHGKKIIVPDPDMAPIVTRVFEWFETGSYSLKEVTAKARADGLRYRRSGRPVGLSTIHYTLRNRLYAGAFEWAGRLYQGTHEPIVTTETWENVQEVLDGRSVSNVRAEPLRFAFAGLITCGHCGCAVVAQMQRGRYIYYHCSGFKQKCPEKYVREEALVQAFEEQLARLHMDDRVFSLIERAIREAHTDKSRERVETVGRLRLEADRLQERLDKLYVDHLDGRITADMHDRMASTWREERARCQRQIELLHNAEDNFVDDGIALLDLARKAHRTFSIQSPGAKNTALDLLVLNSTWAHGKLTVTFREPFGMLEKMPPETPSPEPEKGPENSDVSEWLPE